MSYKDGKMSKCTHFKNWRKPGNNIHTMIQWLLTKYATIPMIFLLATEGKVKPFTKKGIVMASK